MLDPVDLVQQLLERGDDLALDLGRRQAGGIDEDVGQGHDDLRLLLAGGHQHGDQADPQGEDHHHRRQAAAQKDVDNAPEHLFPTDYPTIVRKARLRPIATGKVVPAQGARGRLVPAELSSGVTMELDRSRPDGQLPGTRRAGEFAREIIQCGGAWR